MPLDNGEWKSVVASLILTRGQMEHFSTIANCAHPLLYDIEHYSTHSITSPGQIPPLHKASTSAFIHHNRPYPLPSLTRFFMLKLKYWKSVFIYLYGGTLLRAHGLYPTFYFCFDIAYFFGWPALGLTTVVGC